MIFKTKFQIKLEVLFMSREESKRKLIDTTKNLLRTQGNITVKDIADHSYMNIASVNYHFGSKDALINIVIKEVLDELKEAIKIKVEHYIGILEIEAFMMDILEFVYSEMLYNGGILKYLFLSNEGTMTSANELIKSFFEESEFTELVYKSLSQNLETTDPNILTARYMIIFSSCIMPIFVQLISLNESTVQTFKDEAFKKVYLKQLIELVLNK